MILNLQNIYKDYQQEKLVVPVLKDVSADGRGRRVCRHYGTVRFR